MDQTDQTIFWYPPGTSSQEQYESTYGITEAEDGIKMDFVTTTKYLQLNFLQFSFICFLCENEARLPSFSLLDSEAGQLLALNAVLPRYGSNYGSRVYMMDSPDRPGQKFPKE